MKDCEFGTLKDDLMLHVLIRGLDSERMWRRLFETDNLELPKAIRMCQGMAADLQSWVKQRMAVQKWLPQSRVLQKRVLEMKIVRVWL